MIRGTPKSYRRAKVLRRAMSLPEILLWRAIRARPEFHWRKQHPAGDCILDFYSDKAKLCIEVDGEAHERGDRPLRDGSRDRWLAANGVETVRIPAVEVLRNLDGVVLHIDTIARGRMSHRLR